MSVTYRNDGIHPEVTAGARTDDVVRQLTRSRYHQACLAAAPEPANWPELVRKVRELDAQPQDWPAAEIAAITAPVMLIAADNHVVRLEHAGLCDRAGRVVPMITEFLGA
jgi:hypothetical protein